MLPNKPNRVVHCATTHCYRNRPIVILYSVLLLCLVLAFPSAEYGLVFKVTHLLYLGIASYDE